MIIQGGVFDVIHGLPTLVELCRASFTSTNGRTKVLFELLDDDDPLTGLIRYEELKSSGLLTLPQSHHTANVATAICLDDEEAEYAGGSAGLQRVIDQREYTRILSHQAGARSSNEALGNTRPAIEKRGEGVNVLAFWSGQGLDTRC